MIHLEREFKIESIESKIIKFGSIFAEKLSSESERHFLTRKSLKIEIKIKIDKIYDLKLKFNGIERNIRMKSQFLTKRSLELIHFLAGSKAIYSANSKTIIVIQESISHYYPKNISFPNTLWT